MMLNVEKALKQPGENLEFDLRVPAPAEEFQADQIGFSGDVALHGYMTGIGPGFSLCPVPRGGAVRHESAL